MRLLLFFFLFVWLAACSSNRATITIEPKQSFILGERESSAFKAKLENISDQTIYLRIINSRTKKQTSGFGLAGKGKTEIYVSSIENAILQNNSTEAVKIKANLNKEVEGMRFQSNQLTDAKYLSRDSLISDLNLLEQALTELHPGLYRYNTPQQIKGMFESLRNNLPEQINERDFMVRLAQTTAQLRCGHTYLNPWNMNAELRARLFGGEQYIPIGFTVVNGQFFITENASNDTKLERGAEIFSINAIPIHEIYDSLKTIVKIDGSNYAPLDYYLSLDNYDPSTWQTFDLYLSLFFHLNDGTFTIEYRNYGDNRISVAQLKALSKQERAQKMKRKYGPQILEKERWSLDIINDDLALMKIGTFAVWKWKGFDYKLWFKDAFSRLDSLGIDNLALDIRGNGGGLTAAANDLISYLTFDTLRCDDLGKVYIRSTKINPELLPYSDVYVKPLIDGLPPDFYRKSQNDLFELRIPEDCTDVFPNSSRFKGKIYVFGDGSNVSATYTLLKKAKQFGFATFIGSTTGGNQQGINGGEYVFFNLPYSNVEVDIPLKYYAPKLLQKDQGLSAEIYLKPTQQDIARGQDTNLNYVLQQIKE